jgi:type I restriction enzyme R subunit
MTTQEPIHREKFFELEICKILQKNDWQVLSDSANDPDFLKANYDRKLALLEDEVLDFVKTTQPKEWKMHYQNYNGDSEKQFIKRLCQELDNEGMLYVIKNGFKDRGVKFELCFKKPNNRSNEDTIKLYDQNRLIAVRQLRYSLNNENSIDVVLFLNGLPIATVELKTGFTQSINDAIDQYKYDRKPSGEILLSFKKRALVHFAVSTDEVYMATKLDGENTYFLPFNKGFNFGAGNPPVDGNYRTCYMWDEIWQKDNWLDIITRFIHLEKKDEFDKKGKSKTKETLIFPRYHQLEVVNRILEDVEEKKAGSRYLIQHSAGSGKSNSIAWLAHRLQALHDEGNKIIFDSVIIVTDRRVLDKQLQETVEQFEHKDGVIEYIDEKKGGKGSQLAKALNEKKKIIITTIQTFPNILQDVGDMQGANFAVIIDEAHSSQAGDSAAKLKIALGKTKDDKDEDLEDLIAEMIKSKQFPKNVSFFAFTATPKAKTIELFGNKKTPDSKPEAFHEYSMKQAIEEGFIRDVLEKYTPYKTFYKIAKKVDDNPEFEKDKAVKALTKYIKLHPYQISQKVEIIIEHFRKNVSSKIGGKAKAMLVTDSRQAAVRYQKAFEQYIEEKKYQDIQSIVAFSGAVKDPDFPDLEFTEQNMNGNLKGRDIKEAFDSQEYQVLIVANKFQTGFDQPLLHTMYVDKKLNGVTAVQTLSRLNRMHPDKRDTFVLDFVNDPDEIRKSFEPYYKNTILEEETDPNLLYGIQKELDGYNVYLREEIEAFVKEFYKKTNKNQSILHGYTDPAVDRYKALDEEKRKDFRDKLVKFVRIYDFVCQVVSFVDVDLEKMAIFGRFLSRKIKNVEQSADAIKIDPFVELALFKIEKQAERHIKLEDNPPLKPASEVGTGKLKEKELIALEELLIKVNDLLSGDLSENDKADFTKGLISKVIENDDLRKQAENNSKENFKHGDYKNAVQDAVINRMEKQGDAASQVLNDKYKMEALSGLLLDVVYKALRSSKNESY